MFDYGIQRVNFLPFLAPIVAGAGSIIGGAISAVPAIVGGVAQAAGGLVGGAAGLASGALSGVGELAGGIVGGVTGAVGSIFAPSGLTEAELAYGSRAMLLENTATGFDLTGLAQLAGAGLGIYQSIEQQQLAKEQLKLYEKMLGQEPTGPIYVTPSFSTFSDEVLRPIEPAEPQVIPTGFDLEKYLPYILIGGVTIILFMRK